jgi:hypothetical protein
MLPKTAADLFFSQKPKKSFSLPESLSIFLKEIIAQKSRIAESQAHIFVEGQLRRSSRFEEQTTWRSIRESNAAESHSVPSSLSTTRVSLTMWLQCRPGCIPPSFRQVAKAILDLFRPQLPETRRSHRYNAYGGPTAHSAPCVRRR